jgi:hypothetical protein
LTTLKVKKKRRRGQRQRKLAHLRRRLGETSAISERRRLITKIKQISSHAPVPDS